MYLNNWIVDRPFKLDSLKDVPKVVRQAAFFTALDDKSGFDNVKMHERCQHLLGFQWGGYYFVAKTLPFGFKLSSFIYHTLNLQPASYIRKVFNIPIFLYIDDRLLEEIRHPRIPSGYASSQLATYIVCELLIRLGFCINIKKKNLYLPPLRTPYF